jgi:hypothetical protein
VESCLKTLWPGNITVRPMPGECQMQPGNGIGVRTFLLTSASQGRPALSLDPFLSPQSLYPADSGGCAALPPDGGGAPGPEGEQPAVGAWVRLTWKAAHLRKPSVAATSLLPQSLVPQESL